MLEVNILIALLAAGASGKLHVDAASWTALASGTTIEGDKDWRCARYLSVPCENVDMPCSAEQPVWRLDTEAKAPGAGGHDCWPRITNYQASTPTRRCAP